jgi:NADPH:quinone reductase-like Zn-dependent oxidoreductase
LQRDLVMKAARIHAYGHSDQIRLEDVARPEPSTTELLVRIHDAGVNPIDWKIREGYFAQRAPRPLPFTLGQDFCGVVLAVGAAIEEIEAGDEIYGFANGTYAEYATVSSEMFASKPYSTRDALAAALPTPGLTALQLVNDVVKPERGQRILIHGAAGSVGSIATQLCVAKGARVVATASRHDTDYLVSLGVEQVIDYKSDRFEHMLSELDAVIDLVGGNTFARTVDILREGGVLATTVGPTEAAEGKPVRAVQIIMRRNKQDLETLAHLVDTGTIVPRDPDVLPLEAARHAQELSQSGRADRKIVLEVA